MFEQLRPIEQTVRTHGYVNSLRLWENHRGERFLSRHSLEDTTELVQNLEEEYGKNGLFAAGGSFRFRTNSEQLVFAEHARSLGLAVVPVLGMKEDALILPFVKGMSMDQFIAQQRSQPHLRAVIAHVLTDLFQAHRSDQPLVYGDRWPKNIMVGYDGRVKHIDFDISLMGDCAREYEVAQFFYGLVRDASDKPMVVDILSQANLAQRTKQYHLPRLRNFLGNYATWYGYKHPEEKQKAQDIRSSIEHILGFL